MILVGILALDTVIILISVGYVKQLLKKYPSIIVNNNQIYLHCIIFIAYIVFMLFNMFKPSALTFLLDSCFQFIAYIYIAFLLYKFAIPITQNEDQIIKSKHITFMMFVSPS